MAGTGRRFPPRVTDPSLIPLAAIDMLGGALGWWSGDALWTRHASGCNDWGLAELNAWRWNESAADSLDVVGLCGHGWKLVALDAAELRL